MLISFSYVVRGGCDGRCCREGRRSGTANCTICQQQQQKIMKKKIKKMNVCYEIVACKENEWYGNCEYSVVCGV